MLEHLQTGHAGLNVSELNRSQVFYQELFGFEVMGESRVEGRKFLFLGDGENVLLTLWEQSTGRFEKRRPGLHHLAFQVGSPDALQEAQRRLEKLHVRFQYDGIVPQAEGTVSAGLFFEDPDGTRLEINCPIVASDRPIPVPGAPSCGFF
jgi:catechol-2,3-dioxygenase